MRIGSEHWLRYPFVAVDRHGIYARIGTLRFVWFPSLVHPRLPYGCAGPLPAARTHWNLAWRDYYIAGSMRDFWGMCRSWWWAEWWR